MNTKGITRKYIEVLNDVEPNCFETDREEQWFNAGLQYGLDVADANPKSPWISVEKDLPCNHEDMVKVSIEGVELNTDRVLVMLYDGTIDISFMFKPIPYLWRWNETLEITHWMPIPKLEEE